MYSSVGLVVALVLIAAFSMETDAATTESAKGPAVRTEYSVRDFGAVGDGAKDDSEAFQKAIDEAFLAGGGVVTVPGSPKGYVLARPLLIRPDVTLRGFHAGPTDAHILALADANLDVAPKERAPLRPVPGGLLIRQDKHPAITLAHNSGIAGLTFSYPDQVPYAGERVRVYPPLLRIRGFGHGERVPGVPRTHGIEEDGPISGRSVSVRDIGAINAYHILDIAGANPIIRQVAQITVDGLWGYPLSVGVSIQNSLDTVVLRNIQFRPSFFHGTCGEIAKASIGFALGKSDGCLISDALVFGLGVGVLHKCTEGSMNAFSVRVTNANIEAMVPIWFDSHTLDDQVQYNNCFIYHTTFGFKPQDGDVYSREGHPLFPELRVRPEDFCVVRINNDCERPTCQSYARFVGCGFHGGMRCPICRVEGTQLVRVMFASSHMVYFNRSLLDIAPGAKTLAVITGNDIKVLTSDIQHLIAMDGSGAETRAIFSNNMIQGVQQELVDELQSLPGVTAQGNVLAP